MRDAGVQPHRLDDALVQFLKALQEVRVLDLHRRAQSAAEQRLQVFAHHAEDGAAVLHHGVDLVLDLDVHVALGEQGNTRRQQGPPGVRIA